jgi:hypothetical protein
MKAGMNKLFYPTRSVLLGLISTQIIATYFVWRSNRQLLEKMMAIDAAGFITAPSALVWPSLLEFMPALAGGLFFTMSLGAGLSVASILAAWLQRRLAPSCRWAFVVPVLIWAAVLIAFNRHGPAAETTLFVLVVPPLVYWGTYRRMSDGNERTAWAVRLAFVVPLIITAVFWFTQADRRIFLNVRDFLLWSSPAGKSLNNFYYQYTLYPAEVFKSLQQKNLRTCRLPENVNPRDRERIKKALISLDYLPVTASIPVDLTIESVGDDLRLINHGRSIMDVDHRKFIHSTKDVLETFALKTDTFMFFRRATYFSLLFGLPLAIYLVVFGVIMWSAGWFVSQAPAALIAGASCLAVCFVLLWPVTIGRNYEHEPIEPGALIISDSWQKRVVGLRQVVRERIPLEKYTDYRPLLTSPHVPERYWVARALTWSGAPDSEDELKKLPNDPQPNVVTMAVLALGERRNADVTSDIRRLIEESPHWYVQWYAYRSLRALGWTQTESAP